MPAGGVGCSPLPCLRRLFTRDDDDMGGGDGGDDDDVDDLGVYVDTHLTMKSQIARLSRTCVFYLRRLRSIRGCLEREVVSACIIYQLDYCNSILANLPSSIVAPMQRILKAAARLLMILGPRDNVTPALYTLRWLPMQSWIQLKLCILVHHATGGQSSAYISELVFSAANNP